MADSLAELWKKGTVAPLASDIPEGGLAIDVQNKMAYSRANDGTIFVLGGGTGGGAVDSVNGQVGVVTLDYTHVGAAAEVHDHIVADITDWPTEFPPEAHDHDILYFRKTEHVDASAGAGDAGSPVVLDGLGKLDGSFFDFTELKFIGAFTPSAGTEYPDTTGLAFGAFWVVSGLGVGVSYTFLAGDLAGETVSDGDFMLYGEASWAIVKSRVDITAYYALDGSASITADFAGGGFKLTNIAEGTVTGDAVEYDQFITGLANKADFLHTHTVDDVNGLELALDGKSDVGHGHTINDVTDLQTELDGKAPTLHGHSMDDINGLDGVLDDKLEQDDLDAALVIGIY